MTQRKQARLLLLLVVIIGTMVVARYVLAATRDTDAPVWTSESAAGLQTDSSIVLQRRPSATKTHTPQAVVAPAQKDNANQDPVEEPATGESRVAADADTDNTVAETLWCSMPDGSKRLNLNQATQDELDALPGIGPVIAGAILEEKERRGGFTSLDDLLSVKGIGDARHAKLVPLLCIPNNSEVQ